MTTVQERIMHSAPARKLEPLELDVSFREELCERLADVPLFDNLSGPELRLLIPFLQPYRAPANTTLVAEGCVDNQLGIVLEGKVILTKANENGARKQLKVITPGMCYGETSLVNDLPHPAAAVAETETKLVLLSRKNLRNLAANHAIIGVRLLHKICRLLSLQLRQARDPLVEYLG